MTMRTELEEAIAWAQLMLSGRNTVVGNYLRVLRDAAAVQLATMPADPGYTLSVWNEQGLRVTGYNTRAAASLEASNALARGATKVEIAPCG